MSGAPAIRHGNIAAALAAQGLQFPERAAIIEQRGRRRLKVSFGELSGRARALAAGLAERGVAPGDRVLIFVPMSIDLYVALLGCMHLGAVAVFVDAWADPERLARAVTLAGPRAFVAVPRAHLLRLRSRAIRRIPVKLFAGRRWLQLARAERHASGTPPIPVYPAARDWPALITFTTGSSGAPRGAVRTHQLLWAQHQSLAAQLDPRGDDVDMPTLPIFVLNNLALGISSVLPDADPRRPTAIDPGTVHRQIVSEGVTTSCGSPDFYRRLAEWCQARGERLPLRSLHTGGAPIFPPLARQLVEVTNGEVRILYGSTEVEPIAGITARELLLLMAEPGSPPAGGLCVGRPVPSLELRLVRPHDGPVVLGPAGWKEWEVAPGQAGEIVVRGRHVLTSYLAGAPGAVDARIQDGDLVWLRTGDAAHLDGAGRLWLLGRVGARVRRLGAEVWSLPAELRALEVEGVSHAAYFGVADRELGERAVLCVEAAVRDQARIRAAITAALGPTPVDELHLVAHIPRDPRHASKTDLQRLRAMFDA